MGTWKISIILSAIIIGSQSACPKTLSKEDWGGRLPAIAPEETGAPLPYIVVHHGGTKLYCTTQDECAQIVRSYQDYHMDSHNWNDIGYNFIIGEDGNVYEGRGWNIVGAHAPTFNNRSIGICVIGDFTDRLPNQAALDTLKQMMDCAVEMGHVEENYKMIGHRQSPASSTVCPGDQLFNEITTWNHWFPDPQ